MTTTIYDQDIIVWANEQARLIRARQFDQLDIENVAEEIEDVAKSEQFEFAHLMVALIAYLLKWQRQPVHRSNGWISSLTRQRHKIKRRLKRIPSLEARLSDADWQEDIWRNVRIQAAQELGLASFPDTCPWTIAQILDENWLPE